MVASFEFGRTRITHDPNQRIDQTLPTLKGITPIDFVENIVNIIIDNMEKIPVIGDVVKVLKQLLDTDQNGRLELDDLIGLFTGRGIIDAIMNGLGFAGSGFSLGALLDAFMNLPNFVYNAIKHLITSVFDLGSIFLDLGALRPTSNNLLLSSDFAAAESMVLGPGWAWDGAVGRSAVGSARASASGGRLVQLSNLVQVQPDQKLNVSGWVKWSGVSASSGPGFKFEVQWYSDTAGATAFSAATVGAVSSPGASGGWQQVSSDVTVPAGVKSARVRFSVEATVSAGSVWFDDVELKRTGTMPQSFITNLIPDLGGLRDFAQSAIDAIMNGLGHFGSLFSPGALLNALGNIPQAAVSGLNNALAGVNSFIQNVLDAIIRAIRGVPFVGGSIADLIAEVTGLNTKAVAANTGVNAIAANVNAATTTDATSVQPSGSGPIASIFGTINQVFNLANQAQQAAINASAILSQNSTQGENVLTGMKWETVFAGADGANLSSGDWTGSDLVVRGNNGYVGVRAGLGDSLYYAVTKQKFLTDSQSAYLVWGSADSSYGKDRASGCIVHSNAGRSSGAYMLVTATNISIGRVGNAAWTGLNRTNVVGDIIRFRSDGAENYFVSVNGQTVLSYTNTGTAVVKGADYRYAAMIEQRATSNFGWWYGNVQSDSFTIAAFGMADWASSAAGVTTPSWRLRKGAAGYATLSVSAGSAAGLPSSFLTAQDLAVGCTISTLGSGTVTITNSGWYEIGFTCSSLIGSSTAVRISGSSGSTWYYDNPQTEGHSDKQISSLWGLSVNSTVALGPIASGATTTVFLAAGDVVSPVVFATDARLSGTYTSGSDSASGTFGRANITAVGGPTAAFTGRLVAAS